MVWQLVVPGTHTVTVVNSVLTLGLELVGPASTTTLTTFDPVGAELPEEPAAPDANEATLPPPPPQESAGRHRAAHSPRRHARAKTTVRAHLTIKLFPTISANPRC
jgi:hypothetical protein